MPILQYRPNLSLSHSIGMASLATCLGGNTYAIVGGDGPCKNGKDRGGVLTVECGAMESLTPNESSLCYYELLWKGPQFC